MLKRSFPFISLGRKKSIQEPDEADMAEDQPSKAPSAEAESDKKPNLWHRSIARLGNIFKTARRSKAGDTATEENNLDDTARLAPDDAPPATTQKSGRIDAGTPSRDGDSGDESLIDANKPNLWHRSIARLGNIFKFTRKSSPGETASEESDLNDAVKLSPDDALPASTQRTNRSNAEMISRDSDSEDESFDGEFRPSFTQRMVMRLKRVIARVRKTADRAESESPNEGRPQQTAEEKKRTRVAPVTDNEDHESEEAKPSALRRLLGKPALIAMLVLGIGLASAITYIIMGNAARKHQQEAALALEKRNKALESEYKKLKEKAKALQAENKKLHPPAHHPAGSALNNPATGATASTSDQGNAGEALDCTIVSNKATAGDMLKRCIESYNAASGR